MSPDAIPELIDLIYEAAAVPYLWPDVLGALGRACGAAGGLFFVNSQTRFSWVAAPGVRWIIEDYIAQGWINENVRGAPMIAELHPGFRTDSDLRTAEERAVLPVYRDFLIPRGIDAAAGTVLQGANDDAIVVTLEHFPSHAMANAAVPFLDRMRPHLGRALSLTAHIADQTAANTVTALGLANVAAAVVSGDGRLRAANDRFALRLGDRLSDGRTGVRFADPFVQAHFGEALVALKIGSEVRSIAIAAGEDQPPLALHLLPLRRGARDVFGWDGILILAAEPANASMPSADLLRLLFDLTPGEARVARSIATGASVSETARTLRVGEGTVRAHLKGVFAKIGGNRQADLVRLLAGLGAPG